MFDSPMRFERKNQFTIKMIKRELILHCTKVVIQKTTKYEKE